LAGVFDKMDEKTKKEQIKKVSLIWLKALAGRYREGRADGLDKRDISA
jgi:hypothetical protein